MINNIFDCIGEDSGGKLTINVNLINSRKHTVVDEDEDYCITFGM